jgi:ArsR family transcriptional regulator
MRIAKALADPKRFAILRRIASKPGVGCQQLLERFKVTPATMSHHLKELADADLVEVKREGKHAFLTLRADTFADYQAELSRQIKPARRARK